MGPIVAPRGLRFKGGALWARPGPWHARCNRPADMRSRNPAPVAERVVGRTSTSRRVADVMRREFISVGAAEKLLDAHRTMQLARLRHLLVVDDEGLLVGVVSYRDLQDDVLARANR